MALGYHPIPAARMEEEIKPQNHSPTIENINQAGHFNTGANPLSEEIVNFLRQSKVFDKLIELHSS
jgi:hypothetical protein